MKKSSLFLTCLFCNIIVATAHYNESPYASCSNDPINKIDPDGQDSYLIIWASQPDEYGHAAFGVDNYSLDKKENEYIPNGTMTVFGLFPVIGYSAIQALNDERVRGKFIVDFNVSMEELITNNFRSGEENQPDGVLKISSDYQTDINTKKLYKKKLSQTKDTVESLVIALLLRGKV